MREGTGGVAGKEKKDCAMFQGPPGSYEVKRKREAAPL